MNKTVCVLLAVLLLLPSFLLPCLAEEETAVDPDVNMTAVVEEGDLSDDSGEIDFFDVGDGSEDEYEIALFADGKDSETAENDAAEAPDSVLTIGAAAAETELPRVVDEADLFTGEEEEKLLQQINAVRTEFSFDVVIVTVTDLGGKTDEDFAFDYYDYNGYGCGKNKDGCLLLIYMTDNRGYRIIGTGSGVKIISDSRIGTIGEDIVPSLTAGNYAAACEIFVKDVREYVDAATGFRLKLLIIGAVIGLIIALAVISVLKAQLKSVRSKPNASDYYIDGSLALTGSYDVLVGHHVTRTKRQSESSGSSGHTGSSGTSHSSGGGHF